MDLDPLPLPEKDGEVYYATEKALVAMESAFTSLSNIKSKNRSIWGTTQITQSCVETPCQYNKGSGYLRIAFSYL